MDIKTTFLNGYLSQDVYMSKREGFVGPKYLDKVCKLKISVYALNQASQSWNHHFDEKIKDWFYSK